MERKCCVIIPAYRPGEELIPYIRELLSGGAGLVAVVDDGSGPSYGAVFGQAAECDGCVVLRHRENRGKGAAIKTGIAWYLGQRGQKAEPETEAAAVLGNGAAAAAAERETAALAAGCCGVVTADCDGQHSVKDVLRMAERLCRCETSGSQELILGCRSFDENTPARSLLGNRIISKGFKLFYGLELSDTQTGLRGIPNSLLPEALRLSGQRYEYELNMLIFAQKRGIRVSAVPIETIYLDKNRGSHYRPLMDSLRILGQLCRGSTRSPDAVLRPERGAAPQTAEASGRSEKRQPKARGAAFRRRQSGESYL